MWFNICAFDFDVPATGEADRDGEAATFSSTIVFHSPHPGQRPSHRAESCPQLLHTHIVLYFVFAMRLSLLFKSVPHKVNAKL